MADSTESTEKRSRSLGFWMSRCGDTTPRDVRNQKRLLLVLGIWAVLFVSASFAIKKDLLPEGVWPWVAAAVPAVVGVFVLTAYGRFLREADELLRMIQLRALALGFGVTWLAASSYPTFERLGAPPADGGDYILVMAFFYALGSVLEWRRYR